jgi:hypothetical protein
MVLSFATETQSSPRSNGWAFVFFVPFVADPDFDPLVTEIDLANDLGSGG